MEKYSIEEDARRTKNNLKKIFTNLQVAQENKVYDEKNIHICNNYKKEVHDYFLNSNTNSYLKTVTQMMLNSMKLEKDRLEKLKLEKEIIYQDMVYKNEKNKVSTMYYKDGKNLLCTVSNQNNQCQIKYNKNNKCIYKIKEDSYKKYFILSSIFANEQECTCPNCGNISRIDELIGGCKYCKSKFTIEDLKGKVNTVFGGKKLSARNGFSKVPIVVSAVMLLLGVISFNLIFIGISFLIAAYAIKKGMKTSISSSRVVEHLQKKDTLFSEELLMGNIQTKLDIVHYANKIENLGAIIQIPEQDKIKLIEDYKNVVYCKITKCALIDFNTSNEMDYIDIQIDADLYQMIKEDKIVSNKEQLKIRIMRKTDIKTNNMLEIMMHQCEKCGANMDPLTGICNYCKTSLKLENYDWVISHYEKIK